MQEIVRQCLTEIVQDLESLAKNQSVLQDIVAAAELIAQAIKKNQIVVTAGNGGSMCDAMHLSEELLGRFRGDRPSFGAISISDPSYLTCAANDYGYEEVFSRAVAGLGRAGDVFIGFTTSGKSKNILNALKVARTNKLKCIAIVGKSNPVIVANSDIVIETPGSSGFADRVQEQHGVVIHILIQLVEKLLCP